MRSVRTAAGGKTYRSITVVNLRKQDGVVPVEFLTTAAPVEGGAEPMVLLVLEDKANWSPYLSA